MLCPKHRHPLDRQDPLREDGRGPLNARRHRPRRHSDCRRAGARRGGARAGRGGRLRPGAPGRPGADPLPPGPDQGRDPQEVPSETVNKVCASGMRTIGIADQAIRAGDLNIAVTGGMESMSKAPYLLPDARFGFRMGDVKAIDAMTHDGLTNPFTEQADDQRGERGLERARDDPADMDRLGQRSHQLAAKATDDGRMAEEIVSVTVRSSKGENGRRGRRGDPARHHRRGPGEAEGDRRRRRHPHGRQRPGVNDGAGAVVVASEEWANRATASRWLGPRLRLGRRRLRLPRPDAGEGRHAGAGEDRQGRPTRSTSGRSTRPSPRSRSTRFGCSASTRRR